ncbi:uncharacterized protein EV422DRAFT_8640 [Fimicolochytrium jonesii]|uniref:uncharacterized protein n=1 Tax=Fimicolochytrium jonesii TaxID=1396493 RepID=UPI0022FDBC70|nr:uncharacterized protein EV422DRAFT_8640 [Fimicolochytrium jonesii]KAI8826743.1 hypothetical protein EV422DRAFT_8640 [Fimicolochytrium jonesii]
MVANLLAFGLAACATLISALPTANIQPGDVVDPTPLQPVIVVAPAAVAIDNYPNKQIDFTGKARVYTFDAAADIQDGKVKVHFSVDNWKTVADVDARFAKDTKEFAWTVVLPDGLHPTNVVYAVRYDSSKGTFWDNNNGKNYVVPVDYPVLAPTATAPPTPSSTSTAPAQTSTPGSGQTFALALTPDQPTTNVEGVIEFQPVLSSDPQSLVGFVDSQAPVAFTSAFAINTGKLSNGVHTVTIRAEFGDSAQIATQQFTVNNTLKFVDMWKPVNTVDQDFSDSSLVAQDGKVYVAYEKTVARYASYGAAEPEQIFDGYVQSKYIGISGFTVHDGVVTTLFSNGDLEQRTYYNEPITMFGNQGKVNVNDIPDISNWCSFASLMHVEAKQLLLGNSCQAGRIFKFDILTGKYLGFVNVTGSPAYLTKDDKAFRWR